MTAGGGRGLDRIEASTHLRNLGAQHVLLKPGFQQIRVAPNYLRIVGTGRITISI
ncbi:hypothetical protein [Zhihengliuella salsuginis]|uniref:Uncharacterized protein n=1 Tax=Zhihengliuella salsuginis TaxID=578222 RepID=A0ABQ3GDY6_9MICC|nr:hypothetical protein [Zhihengliuella salsuginis]GHD00607.1 hypothetical protein GCM10008096_04110 [Zhihengliuella salsuginis]